VRRPTSARTAGPSLQPRTEAAAPKTYVEDLQLGASDVAVSATFNSPKHGPTSIEDMAARQQAILRRALEEVRTVLLRNGQEALAPGRQNARIFDAIVASAFADMRDLARAARRQPCRR